MALGRGFEKLAEVLKDLHSRQRLDHQEVEGRHQKVMDKMESRIEIFKHIRSGIKGVKDALKNTNWTLVPCDRRAGRAVRIVPVGRF